MIINTNTTNILVAGDNNSKKATIDSTQFAKLSYILTSGLYQDPISSVINELAANMVDSVVASGKDPIENPSFVKIYTLDNKSWIEFVDKGLGLSRHEFETVVMSYLTSTKDKSDSQIGSFGLGCKSSLALKRPAEWTCVKDGRMSKFLFYQGAEFAEYDLLEESDTNEENGVTIKLQIKDWSEKNDFISKARQKLAYFDEVVLIVNDSIINNKIYRHDLFQYSSLNNNSSLSLCLKDVYYPLNYESLGIERIDIPIALRFNLTDPIVPSPSRESIIYNQETKKLILDRIKMIADHFVGEYNKTIVEKETFLETLDFIDDTNKYVKVESTRFNINDLVSYSSIVCNKISCKGISLIPLDKYQRMVEDLFTDFTVVAEKSYNAWKNKKLKGYDLERQILDKKRVRIVDSLPTHKVKSYFVDEGISALYIVNNNLHRIGFLKGLYKTDAVKQLPKEKRKDGIKEILFLKAQLQNSFEDLCGLEKSQEFLDYLEECREEMREKRKNYDRSGDSNYKRLDKQKGQVTILKPREHAHNSDRIVFDKEAVDVSSFAKNKFKTLLFLEEDKDLAIELYKVLKGKKRIKVRMIIKKDSKKVINQKQVIMFAKGNTLTEVKELRKIGTAIIFKQVVDKYEELFEDSKEIVQKLLKPYHDSYERLKWYVQENEQPENEVITETIVQELEKSKNYDYTLWKEFKEVQEVIENLGFISILKEPDNWNKSEVKLYERHINETLLFRKMKYPEMYSNMEVCVRNEEPVEELVEIEEEC